MTHTWTQSMQYACIAIVAGLLVTGVPAEGNARNILNDVGAGADILDFESADLAYNAPVCGDRKGKDCKEGDDRRCVSKQGVKLCQTCTDGKWGSGHHGDCWGKSENTAATAGTSVLEAF